MNQQDHTLTISKIKESYGDHQNLSYALVGGLGVSIICAFLWAAFTVITNYQVGLVAIVVGLIVGFSVRYFGAGLDFTYGIIGALFALFSCLLGNLLAQIGFIAQMESIGHLEVLKFLDFEIIKSIMVESFSPMDVLFFGIAGYEGFKFAIRPVTEEDVSAYHQKKFDPAPPLNHLRFPLAIASILFVSAIYLLFSSSSSGEQTYYYDSGEILAQGLMDHGHEDGEWNYYHPNGSPQASGVYDQGLEIGTWNFYDSLGQIIKTQEYDKGTMHGSYITYQDGAVLDSGRYEHNREVGIWTFRYPEGALSQKGLYVHGRQNGKWTFYYPDGTISAKGVYKNGAEEEIWRYYDESGDLMEEIEYNNGEFYKLNYAQDNGVELVKNGNGQYTYSYENGNIQSTGRIKEGYLDGLWIHYYSDGSKQYEIEHHRDESIYLHAYDREGNDMLTQGNGQVVFTYDSGNREQEGEIKNGKFHGTWNNYYDENNQKYLVNNYVDGELNGRSEIYSYDGSLVTEGAYQDGLKEGEWIWYHYNGNIESSVAYIQDKKQSIQRFFNESGIETKQEIYDNGVLLEEKMMR